MEGRSWPAKVGTNRPGGSKRANGYVLPRCACQLVGLECTFLGGHYNAGRNESRQFSQVRMSSPTYRAWTKSIRSDGAPGYSANWVAARRAWLSIFPDRLECGSTVIPAEAVTDAVLYEARQWFIPVYILSVTTANETWQFGLNPWTDVGNYLPFAFRRERVRLQYSLFSIAVRAIWVACAAYLIYRYFKGH